MKMKIMSTIAFTEKEYEVFNRVCMMLDDLINTDEYRATFSEIVGETIDLNEFYDTFATLTDYVEEHRE